MGLILSQWAKHLGATVIGTVGSPEKAEVAAQNGCDHVINYGEENFAKRVREITQGEGCDVVYDGVGKATFPASLDCLKPMGCFVSFGVSSGPIESFNIMMLAEKGSLYATWPVLTRYLAKREDVLSMSQELFDVIGSGAVVIRIHAVEKAYLAHKGLGPGDEVVFQHIKGRVRRLLRWKNVVMTSANNWSGRIRTVYQPPCCSAIAY